MKCKLLLALCALMVLCVPGNAKRYSLASAIRAQNKQVIAVLDENLQASARVDSVTDPDLVYLAAKFGTHLPCDAEAQPSSELLGALAQRHYGVSAPVAEAMAQFCTADSSSARPMLADAYALYLLAKEEKLGLRTLTPAEETYVRALLSALILKK